MNDGHDLERTPTGSAAFSLAKLEAWAEQSREQAKRDAEKRERILDLLGQMREDYARFSERANLAISQFGNDIEEHGNRLTALENADRERKGANKLVATLGHGASASAGGAIVWALQRLFGHG